MATENTPSASSAATDPSTVVHNAADEGIVSVNDRGRRQSGRAGPFMMIGGVALVVLIGGLATVNVVRSKFSGPKRPPSATSADSSGLARTFNTDTPPPLPGTSRALNPPTTIPACPDGTAGNALRGQDGLVVRNAAGQSVRVCANGQVIGVTPPQDASAQPIPVAPSRPQPVASSERGMGYMRPARASDGPMMLNDSQPGPKPPFALPGDPQGALQGVLGVVQPGAPSNAPRTEGLLTAPAAGTLAAELTPSTTPLIQAATLGDLNLLLPKGRTIDCGMSMRTISALAGQVSCVVTSNVYSANGKVLLIERGSEAVGEYRSGASIGQKRLFVLWNRIITPTGVVINLNSPGADALGSTGLTGKVDNHWFERIGSAFLLSTTQDAIQYEIAEQQGQSGGSTLVLGNTSQAGSQMADRILQATINIPPTIYKNQGDRAVIYVARDLDFSNVYRLRSRP